MTAEKQNSDTIRAAAGAGLALETIAALALAWILVFVLPLRRAKALFGPPREAQGKPPSASSMLRAAGVAWHINRLSPRLPWRCTCLVQATAGALLLRRRGIDGVTIRFGVRKQDGKLRAHAWLLLGETVLLGEKGKDSFTPVADLRTGVFS